MSEITEQQLSPSERILNSAKVVEGKDKSRKYILEWNGNRMTITPLPTIGEVHIDLDINEKRFEIKDITELYKAAKTIIQKIAHEMQRDIKYNLFADSIWLKKWAQKQGRDIFEWDSENVSGLAQFTKTFLV